MDSAGVSIRQSFTPSSVDRQNPLRRAEQAAAIYPIDRLSN